MLHLTTDSREVKLPDMVVGSILGLVEVVEEVDQVLKVPVLEERDGFVDCMFGSSIPLDFLGGL